MATFTEDQIRHAVLTYSEGCTPGKITFLRDAFDINASCEQEVNVTVRITVPMYDDNGDQIEGGDVASAIESCLDQELRHWIEAENSDCINAHVRSA